MPRKSPHELEVIAFPSEKMIRVGYSMTQGRYQEIMALASKHRVSEDAVIGMLLAVGLDILTNDACEVFDAVGLQRFLRGDDT